MFSFVELSDGRLYATEIARSSASIGMATLSACDSGSLSVVTKDEPDGLARALLARGARFVVGTSWKLDDEAASVMMPAYYKALIEGGEVTDGLRTARGETRARWPHPYFWGPLVAFGGYR
jgi:CHAT domain-containing protein